MRYRVEDFYVVVFTEGVGVRCVWCRRTSPLMSDERNRYAGDRTFIPQEMDRVKHNDGCALERAADDAARSVRK